MAKGSNFAFECVSNGIISRKCLFRPIYEVFLAIKVENLNVEKYEVIFSEQKTFSSFKIASLPDWDGAKNAGGSRPSCYFLPHM